MLNSVVLHRLNCYHMHPDLQSLGYTGIACTWAVQGVCFVIWQMMMAVLHSNGQLTTEKDGDTEKGCQKPQQMHDYRWRWWWWVLSIYTTLSADLQLTVIHYFLCNAPPRSCQWYFSFGNNFSHSSYRLRFLFSYRERRKWRIYLLTYLLLLTIGRSWLRTSSGKKLDF